MLVLEDPRGIPLEMACRREGDRMDLTFFLRVAVSLANAIGQVHQKGIVHKDIKPANVLVDTTSCRVWLMGFGIASRLPRERQETEAPELIAGTPNRCRFSPPPPRTEPVRRWAD
jgi:serine/threonine protein kinase